MARSRALHETTPTAPPVLAADALGLLTRDHRLADELFAEFGRAAEQQLDPLARRICKMLRVHTQIEEEIFYPAARKALPQDDFIEAAGREHASMLASIVRIESMSSAHAQFRSTVSELARQVAHHVGEEERQLFARLRATRLDLVALGVALAERRDTLLDVFGLHDDDEEGAANQRETHGAAEPEPERPSARQS